MAPDELDALRQLAGEIAREAGEIAREGRASLGPGHRVPHDTKSSDVDPVTEFDRRAEEHVVARLRAARPDDAIVGEEGTDDDGSSGLAWHVDPIDGTVNFVYDLPGWCCSVAVVRDGEPVAGAVYVPPLDQLFSAAAGRGAFQDDVRLHVSSPDAPATSLIATGFNYDRHQRVIQGGQVAGLLGHVRDIRRMGSAAFDLACVAAGRVDAYYERHLNSWDVAAGVLLVREAGGVVTTIDGDDLDVLRPASLLATSPALHEPLVGLLAAVGAGGDARGRIDA